MKHLAYILSLYILVLLAIPCADVPTDNSLSKVELSSNATHHPQNDLDHCSPFCTCSCCACPVVFQCFISHFDWVSFPPEHVSTYSSVYIFSFCTSFWQPPKLG